MNSEYTEIINTFVEDSKKWAENQISLITSNKEKDVLMYMKIFKDEPEELNKMLSMIEKTAEDSIQAVEKQLEEKISVFTKQVNDYMAEVESKKKTIMENIDSKIQETKDNINKSIKNAGKQLEEKDPEKFKLLMKAKMLLLGIAC